MINKKTLTPILLAGVFFIMLGLSFAAVPLYDIFCRVTGFGGTTQVSKEAPDIILAGIFFIMLGLSFAAVPLYDIFCRVTGFGGTTQISKEAPDIVLDQTVSVRFDTNVNKLPWNFKVKKNVMDVNIGQVNKIEFEVENYGDETTYGVAAFNVSPSSFGRYYSKLGCFCFEKQVLKAGEKATYIMTFYLDPEMVNDPNTKNIKDVTMSYTFFSSDYYNQSKL